MRQHRDWAHAAEVGDGDDIGLEETEACMELRSAWFRRIQPDPLKCGGVIGWAARRRGVHLTGKARRSALDCVRRAAKRHPILAPFAGTVGAIILFALDIRVLGCELPG